LWDEVTGEWRILHNEKLYALYCSTNTIRVLQSRRMRWAEHVASMGERRGSYRVWWGNWTERDHLEHLSVDGSIILKFTFKKWDMGRHGLDGSGLGRGQVASVYEYGNEPPI